MSLFLLYWPLTSCKISEKTNERSLGYLKTNRQTPGQTHWQVQLLRTPSDKPRVQKTKTRPMVAHDIDVLSIKSSLKSPDTCIKYIWSTFFFCTKGPTGQSKHNLSDRNYISKSQLVFMHACAPCRTKNVHIDSWLARNAFLFSLVIFCTVNLFAFSVRAFFRWATYIDTPLHISWERSLQDVVLLFGHHHLHKFCKRGKTN